MKRILSALVVALCISAPASAQEMKDTWNDHPSLRAGKVAARRFPRKDIGDTWTLVGFERLQPGQ